MSMSNRSDISRLMKNLSQANHAISEAHRSHVIDDEEAEARHALLYMNASLAFFKKNKDFAPEAEFRLLIEMIDKIPKNHSLLKEYIHHLITINDLLNDSVPEKKDERLGSISQSIEKCSDNIFIEMNELKDSETAKYIATIKPLQITQKQIADVTSEDIVLAFENAFKRIVAFKEKNDNTVSANVSTVLWEQYNKEMLEQFTILTNTSIPIENIDKKEKALQKLIDFYLAKQIEELQELKIENNHEEFKMLIRYMHFNSHDKQSFVENFLNEYQNLYSSLRRNDVNEKNILLKQVALIIPILCEPLDSEQFNTLFLKNEFNLEDPEKSENDTCYRFYKQWMIFYGIENGHLSDDFDKLVLTSNFINANFENLGKLVVQDILSPKSETLKKLPLFFQHYLSNQAPLINNEFESFVKSFITVNDKAPTYQKRNLTLFFLEHYYAICQIIDIMGVEGIRYMKNHLAETVLPLEKTLESTPTLPENIQKLFSEYFLKCNLSVKKHSDHIHAIKTCLTISNTLLTLKPQSTLNFEEEITKEIEKALPPKELLTNLVRILLKTFFQEMEIELNDEKITKIFEKMNPVHFSQLAAASQHMLYDQYHDIFLHLLKLDLLGNEEEVYQLLHNTEQENPILRALAKHNQYIQTILTKYGISPEKALRYNKIFNFIIYPHSETDTTQANLHHTLWTYLEKLEQETIDFLKDPIQQGTIDKTNLSRINAIKNNIEQLHHIINKNPSPGLLSLSTTLMNGASQALIKKISGNIKSIQQDTTLSLPSSLREFMEHVNGQINTIRDLSPKDDAAPPSKDPLPIQYFSVEQWPKEKIETFFLGDHVGCCLATTNTQFQAMVQRRMDDAMLFHVAIDQMTGQPAALIWLYLAETADGKVALIANFFEVNAKYAVNNAYRIGLLNGLLHFTQQFCEDNPGIDAFYMNQLTYGWNKEDLKEYPIVEVKLNNKLGGPYIPGMTAEQINAEGISRDEIIQCTQEHYYIASLKQELFHEFRIKFLKENSHTYLPLEAIIKQSILEMIQREQKISLEDLVTAIMKQHSIELRPFYKKDIATGKNAELKSTVSKIIIDSPSLFPTMQEEAAEYLLKDSHSESSLRSSVSHQTMFSTSPQQGENKPLPDVNKSGNP